MSGLQKIQEQLFLLKVSLVLAVGLDACLIAWLAQNYETAKTPVVLAALLASVTLTVSALVINRRAFRLIRETGD